MIVNYANAQTNPEPKQTRLLTIRGAFGAAWVPAAGNLGSPLRAPRREIEKLKSELQTAKASIPAPAAKPETASGITAAGSGVKTVSSKLLDLEIVRVEGMLAEVTKLLDDPASALSTVMRKNAEKTELESYLRGIRFATGQDVS